MDRNKYLLDRSLSEEKKLEPLSDAIDQKWKFFNLWSILSGIDSIDRCIDTVGWMWTDGSMSIGLTRILWSIIDTIDREKIFHRWIDTISGQHDQ
jgi:hypothetical protein